MCSARLCNTELAGPSRAPWRHPKGFAAEESNCSKYVGSKGQPQDDFQTTAEETVSRECDSRGDACMSSSALFSTTCGRLVQDICIWRARICPRRCFTPGSGHMPWTGKVWQVIEGLCWESVTCAINLDFLAELPACSCRMTVLVWIIQCMDLLAMSAEVWNGRWSRLLGEQKGMVRSHGEAKGEIGVKCCIRNKYEEWSAGEKGE